MTPRVLFVNSGILGLISFHQFLQKMLPGQSVFDWCHILLTEDLTIADRIVRRALATRLWKDGAFGVSNLDLVRFRLELFAGLLARRRIARIGLRPGDVLHFHRQASAYASLDLMRRVPSIVSLDCTQECVIQGAGRLERATYRPNVQMDGAIFRRAFALVATSNWAADSVRRYYAETAPIHVMPNPVLFEWFDTSWMDLRTARAEQGATPRLLFMGGDFPRKGGYDLLDAWESGAFHQRASLDIVTTWKIDRPLPPGVTVHRNIQAHSPEWGRRWAEADIFVLPTRNEAFGLVFQEAGAAGLPVIGTAINAIPEIVFHEETGFLVPAGNRQALADAMDRLIASPALRDTFGRRARAFIETSASPATYLDRLTSLIVDAAKTR